MKLNRYKFCRMYKMIRDEIVKLKDITKGIACMMVLDLRTFDIVEGVGYNELFILITNPDYFENLKISGSRAPLRFTTSWKRRGWRRSSLQKRATFTNYSLLTRRKVNEVRCIQNRNCLFALISSWLSQIGIRCTLALLQTRREPSNDRRRIATWPMYSNLGVALLLPEIPGRWRRHCTHGPIMSESGCNLVSEGTAGQNGNTVSTGRCVCGPSVPWCPNEPRPYDYATRRECTLNLAAKMNYGEWLPFWLFDLDKLFFVSSYKSFK